MGVHVEHTIVPKITTFTEKVQKQENEHYVHVHVHVHTQVYDDWTY